MLEYWLAHWAWLLLCILVGMAGTLAFLRALLAAAGGVRDTVGTAAVLLPTYLAASLIAFVLVLAGLLLLIVPGLYLMARLAPLASVVAAERRFDPLDAVLRTFDLTRGHAWPILLYLGCVWSALYGVLLPIETNSSLAEALLFGAAGLFTMLVDAGVYRHLVQIGQPASPAPTTGT